MGVGGLFQPSGAGWVGCGRRDHSSVWNQETGEEGVIQGGVVARSGFAPKMFFNPIFSLGVMWRQNVLP